MSNHHGTLGLYYSTSIVDALESMHLINEKAFSPNLWSMESFLHDLAKRCHTTQVNDWHRIYIENTCVSIMNEKQHFYDSMLPGGVFPISLIAYVVNIAQQRYGDMNVIQCFRYGMMSFIHGEYGTMEDLLQESTQYFSEQNDEQHERIRKKSRLLYSKQIASRSKKTAPPK